MAAFKRQSFKWDYELDQKLDNFISYFFVLTLKRKLGLSGSPFLSHVTSGVGDPEILHLSLMFAPSFTVNVGRSSETFGADAEKKNFHFLLQCNRSIFGDLLIATKLFLCFSTVMPRPLRRRRKLNKWEIKPTSIRYLVVFSIRRYSRDERSSIDWEMLHVTTTFSLVQASHKRKLKKTLECWGSWHVTVNFVCYYVNFRYLRGCQKRRDFTSVHRLSSCQQLQWISRAVFSCLAPHKYQILKISSVCKLLCVTVWGILHGPFLSFPFRPVRASRAAGSCWINETAPHYTHTHTEFIGVYVFYSQLPLALRLVSGLHV